MIRRDFLRTLSMTFMSAAFWRPCAALAGLQDMTPRNYAFSVLETYPHDPGAFTQGLLFHEGLLYESTGGWGTSSIRQVELETGRVLKKRDLARHFFGEGVALWEDRLIQLTWRSGTGFVYDLATLEPRATFPYSGEGWGLTEDGSDLIMSDGTNQLRRLDPNSYEEIARLEVFAHGRPVSGVNELEYIDGEIWANIFPTERIARIDPASGQVTAWLELSGILGVRRQRSPDAVPNGIAWDQEGQRIFVTGKLWPVLFEIAVAPLYT